MPELIQKPPNAQQYRCPNCGGGVSIMAATCELDFTAEGETLIENVEFDREAPARCLADWCGWRGYANEAEVSSSGQAASA